MRGKAPFIPAEPLNNFSVAFQVSPSFTYGTGIQSISLTSTEPPAGAVSVVSGWGTLSTLLISVTAPDSRSIHHIPCII
jgi:hypothetical protein